MRSEMDSNINEEISYDCRLFRVYKDGRVQVPFNFGKVPPSDDAEAGVRSKDVIISPETGVSARLYLPKTINPDQKLTLLFYIHGGGFCMSSPFAPDYHNFLNRFVSQSKVIAISIAYRLFPDCPLPACYEDSWAALQWVASHSSGKGPERWLNHHADFDKVFIGGDSAGANISHTLAVRVGSIGLPHNVKVVGVVLVHPFFSGTSDDELWMYMCEGNEGLDDPRLKPAAEDLAKLGCERVLGFVARRIIDAHLSNWHPQKHLLALDPSHLLHLKLLNICSHFYGIAHTRIRLIKEMLTRDLLFHPNESCFSNSSTLFETLKGKNTFRKSQLLEELYGVLITGFWAIHDLCAGTLGFP